MSNIKTSSITSLSEIDIIDVGGNETSQVFFMNEYNPNPVDVKFNDDQLPLSGHPACSRP